MKKDNYNFRKAALILAVLLLLQYLWRFPENKIKNEMSYNEFIENVEINNVKPILIVEGTIVTFEIRNTDVDLKTQRKTYEKIKFSSKIGPAKMNGFIKYVMDKGYKLEFIDVGEKNNRPLFSIYDYLRFATLIIFVVYAWIFQKKKERKPSPYYEQKDDL